MSPFRCPLRRAAYLPSVGKAAAGKGQRKGGSIRSGRAPSAIPRKVLRGLIWQPPIWIAPRASPLSPRLVLAAACLRPRRLAQGRYAFGRRVLRGRCWWCWWWWACCRRRCWWCWWWWSLSGSVACFRRVLRIGGSRRIFCRGLVFPLFHGCSRFFPRGGRCPPHPIRTYLIFFSRARRAGDTPCFKKGVPYRGCAPLSLRCRLRRWWACCRRRCWWCWWWWAFSLRSVVSGWRLAALAATRRRAAPAAIHFRDNTKMVCGSLRSPHIIPLYNRFDTAVQPLLRG